MSKDRKYTHAPEARAARHTPAVGPRGAVVRPVGYMRLMHVSKHDRPALEERPTVRPDGSLRTVWVPYGSPVTPAQQAAMTLLAKARRHM